MTDTTDTASPEFNFDAFMYGVRRDAPFDGSTLADSIDDDEVRRIESAFNSVLKRTEALEERLRYTEETLIAANDLLTATEKERDELKGDQVPVAWLNDAHLARGHIEGEAGEEDAGPGMIPVYREKYFLLQNPVISKEKLCDWLEDNFDIDDSKRDAFADCFAHSCNCIVKEGD